MIVHIWGELEIDCQRGVIYFHNDEGRTKLRICNINKPIAPDIATNGMLDITHMIGASWQPD